MGRRQSPSTPATLGVGGRKLWDSVDRTDMTEASEQLLLETCRVKDRLDKLDAILRGDAATWIEVNDPERGLTEVYIDKAAAAAVAAEGQFKQMLMTLQLLGEAVRRKGGNSGAARGAYTSASSKAEKGTKVTPFDRATG